MPEENKKDICKKETLICSSLSLLLFLSRLTWLALWLVFFCCCLFHFHKETLIHSEMNPQFLLVKPERATSPTTMALLFSTPARRRQPDSVDILGGVTPRKRVQAFSPPRAVFMSPSHTSPLAHPHRLPAADLGTAGPLVQLCNGTVFSTYAGEEYVHYCRWTQARALVHPCPPCAVGPAGCASCAQGQAATPPKEQRKSVFTIAWEPGINSVLEEGGKEKKPRECQQKVAERELGCQCAPRHQHELIDFTVTLEYPALYSVTYFSLLIAFAHIALLSFSFPVFDLWFSLPLLSVLHVFLQVWCLQFLFLLLSCIPLIFFLLFWHSTCWFPSSHLLLSLLPLFSHKQFL